MESFQKKPTPSFTRLDKESPKKGLNNSEVHNMSSKKSLLSFLTKKRAVEGPEVAEAPPKANEGESRLRAKPKQKLINRKNISDGRIRLNVIENDRVPEDYFIDYKDNPYDGLDQNPSRTTSYIENLRSRDFSQINNREVKRFVESQQQNKDVAPRVGMENLEIELLELSKSYEGFLAKFFRFFQGLLPGFCVIHLFLIFAGSDDQTILNSYVLSGLRIYQIFFVVALISTIGACNRYLETKTRYHEAIRSQPMLKESLGKQKTKYLIASISFFFVYAIIVFNREFVALLSAQAGNVNVNDLDTRFNIFRVLSSIMTLLSLIGWFTLILAFEELSKHQNDAVNYLDLTGDESTEEEV